MASFDLMTILREMKPSPKPSAANRVPALVTKLYRDCMLGPEGLLQNRAPRMSGSPNMVACLSGRPGKGPDGFVLPQPG